MLGDMYGPQDYQAGDVNLAEDPRKYSLYGPEEAPAALKADDFTLGAKAEKPENPLDAGNFSGSLLRQTGPAIQAPQVKEPVMPDPPAQKPSGGGTKGIGQQIPDPPKPLMLSSPGPTYGRPFAVPPAGPSASPKQFAPNPTFTPTMAPNYFAHFLGMMA